MKNWALKKEIVILDFLQVRVKWGNVKLTQQ